MNCTRCEGTGFLNLWQVDDEVTDLFDETGDYQGILDWIDNNSCHDVSVCDCCGDGVAWNYLPGLHHASETPECM